MERRRFTREFKLEAVRLIRDRGVSYAQASEDLKVHPTQLRKVSRNQGQGVGIMKTVLLAVPCLVALSGAANAMQGSSLAMLLVRQ
jgi:transposase-like protein